MDGLYRVLIVDDEPWICKLIRNIVEWERLGFQIVGECGNGRQALEIIPECHPDLIITDIRMSGMDGVSLMAAVRNMGLKTEFFVISGYNDFEYARSAVSYKAFCYLLKPIDKNEIQMKLLELRKKLEEERDLRNNLEMSRMKLLTQNLHNSLINPGQMMSCESFNREYATGFRACCFRVLIAHHDLPEEMWLSREEDPLPERVLESFRRVMTGGEIIETLILEDRVPHRGIMILNYTQDRLSEWEENWKQILAAEEYSGISVGVSGEVDSFGGIPAAYTDATHAVVVRILNTDSRILAADRLTEEIVLPQNCVGTKDAKAFQLALEMGNAPEAQAIAAELFESARRKYPASALVYPEIAAQIINLLSEKAQNREAASAESFLPAAGVLKEHLAMCGSQEQIAEYIRKLIDTYAAEIENDRLNRGDKIINEMKKYIEDHYREDVALADLARHVCLNANYVSELFRKKTGETFSEYLADYRISIAKDLLRDIRFKVVDVSVMVGYSDEKYFSRLFKKKVGVSPNAYKRLYV